MMRLAKNMLIVMGFMLAMLGFSAKAALAINVSGTISSNTIWSSGNTYIMTGTVTVNSGVTLTIEPGVEVRAGGNYGLFVNGTLLASGVLFTHNTSTTKGSWPGVTLTGAATNGSQIIGCEIRYAVTGITLNTSSPKIVGCNIINSSGYPIGQFANSWPTYTDSSYSNNSFSGNTGGNAVAISGTISTNGTYTNGGFPYVVDKAIAIQSTVTIASGVTIGLRYDLNINASAGHLIVNPGAVIKAFSSSIGVITSGGTMQAVGLGYDPIYFTSWNDTVGIKLDSSTDDPLRGSWSGIDFGTDSNPSDSYYNWLEYCVVSYATNDLTMQSGSQPRIYNNTFREALLYPVVQYGGAWPVYNSSVPFSTNSITSNANNAISILGTTSTNGSYYNWGVPYYVTGSLVIQSTVIVASGVTIALNAYSITLNASASDLTLQPGVVIKGKALTSITVSAGLLDAQGLSYDQIYFTSWNDNSVGATLDTSNGNPAKGNWTGLIFSAANSSSLLVYCQLRYATTALSLSGSSSPTIQDCSFDSNTTPILQSANSWPNYTGNAFSNNTTNGVNISGTITTTGSYKNIGVPYILTGGLIIQAKVTVENDTIILSNAQNITINGASGHFLLQPGTILKFLNCGIYVSAGKIESLGQSGWPVVMTSWYDDSQGGATDGSSTAPAAGNWDGVDITSTTAGNILTYTEFYYPDYAINTTTAPTITSCFFQYSSTAPILQQGNSWPTYDQNLQFANNPKNGVVIYGTVTTPGTYGNYGFPYFVTSTYVIQAAVRVQSGVQMALLSYDITLNSTASKLTIEPGAIIKGQSAGITVSAGYLDAQGSSGNPVIFTSWYDDNYGGNLDGSSTAPAANQWTGISLSAANNSSILRNGYIAYADYGIDVLGGNSPTIQSCTLEKNYYYGIQQRANAWPTYDNNIQFIGNGSFGVGVYGTVTTSGTYSNYGFPYIVRSTFVIQATVNIASGVVFGLNSYDITVNSDSGKLVIAPGAIIKAKSAGIVVSAGSLDAQGTSGNEIILTSWHDDTVGFDLDGLSTEPARNNWRGVELSAPNSLSILKYCIIRYASYGINLSGGASPQILYCDIQECYYYGIQQLANSWPTYNGSVLIANNGKPGVAISGTVTSTGSYVNYGFPYVISTTFVIQTSVTIKTGVVMGSSAYGIALNSANSRLVIEPGAVFKFYSVNIAVSAGSIDAQGTSGSRIILTSWYDDTVGGDLDGGSTAPAPGNWTGIDLSVANSTTSILKYLDLRYADYGVTMSNGCSPQILSSIFQKNSYYGIRQVANSWPTYDTSLQFSENTYPGVGIDGTITVPGTYVNKGFPYVVRSTFAIQAQVRFQTNLVVGMIYDIQINSSAGNLIIEPGVTFRAKGSGVNFYNTAGNIDAQGTSTNRIIFTSWYDDAHGGDLDGTTTAPAAGQWGSIYFNGSGTSGIFKYCYILYAVYGIDLDLGSPQILSNIFEKNNYAILQRANSWPTYDANNSFVQNTNIGVILYDNVTTPGTYPFINHPYVVLMMKTSTYSYPYYIRSTVTFAANTEIGLRDQIYVNNANGRLNLSEGVIVKGQSGLGITVSNGFIDAQGTSTNRVVFTSWKDDSLGTDMDGLVSTPARGDWDGVNLSAANSTSSIFKYCHFRYANYGLELTGGNSPQIKSCIFEQSLYYGIRQSGNSWPSYDGYNVFINNANPGAAIDGTWTVAGTFGNYGFPYVVRTTCTLQTSVRFASGTILGLLYDLTVSTNGVIILDPGVIVKASGSGYGINVTVGSISAVGTPTNPVIFTSWKDDAHGGDTNGDSNTTTPAAGNWQGVALSVNDNFSAFRYCYFLYASYGINLSGGNSPQIKSCTFEKNSYAIQQLANSWPTYDQANSFINNTNIGVMVSGTVTVGGIYTKINHPYVLTANLTIQTIAIIDSGTEMYLKAGDILSSTNGLLDITPGAIIKSNGSYCVHVNIGAIHAQGTAGNPIIFTSYKDDSVGTDLDGSPSTPAIGDWVSIYLYAPGNYDSIMKYCNIRYATYGIHIYNGNSPQVWSNTFEKNTYGIYQTANSWPNYDSNNQFINNTNKGVAIAGTVTTAGTYVNRGFPYILISTLTIQENVTIEAGTVVGLVNYDITISTNTTPEPDVVGKLIAKPGVIFKATSGDGFNVSAGTIEAIGTSTNPIIFTSWKDDDHGGNSDGVVATPAVGDWQGVYISTPNSSSSILKYCTVLYGTYGIYAYNTASPTIQSSTFYKNTYPIRQEANSWPTYDSNLVFSSNTNRGILISGTATTTGSFPNIGLPFLVMTSSNYYIRSQVTLKSGAILGLPGTSYDLYIDNANGKLIMEPGSTVKSQGGKIYVTSSGGSLDAQGTPEKPILFTSYKDDSQGFNMDGAPSTPAIGDWPGIYLYNPSITSVIKYAQIQYATYGVILSGAAPILNNNNFFSNTYGIYLTGTTAPAVVNNCLVGNSSYGAYNATSTNPVLLENNWWGQTSGPTHTGNPGGTGDKASNYIDYNPWISSPISCTSFTEIDTDNDGVPDDTDNCVNTPNANQIDCDNDGIGNACDSESLCSTDSDGDGLMDNNDNCIHVANVNQADCDSDGIGDACDTDSPCSTDSDGDGIKNDHDNCIYTANANQADCDSDGIGNVCDNNSPCSVDSDGDGVMNDRDNCIYVANTNQADCDSDGIGNACDPDSPCSVDSDGDGVMNDRDNCIYVANANQVDCDRDGIGDACDTNMNCDKDTDGDGVPDIYDNCPSVPNTYQEDSDSDGFGDACDPRSQSPDTVGQWKMNDADGTIAKDSSGGSNNGTVTNPLWVDSELNEYFNRPISTGTALLFDGDSDAVTVADNTLFDLASTVTLEAWVKPDYSGSTTGNVISKGTAYALQLRGNNFLGMINNQTISTPLYNEWNHLVMTFDSQVTSNNLKLYVNGWLKQQGTISADIVTNNEPFLIGKNFKGMIDNASVYRGALNITEIRKLCFAISGGMVGRWQFDLGYGTTGLDSAGVYNHGTLLNGTIWVPSLIGDRFRNFQDSGNALRFNGSNQYVSIPDSDTLDFGTGNFAIEVWLKTSEGATSDWKGVVAKYSSPTGLWLQLDPTNKYVGFGWDGSNYLVGNEAVNDGQWHHIFAQRTGPTSAEIYIDGHLDASGSTFPNKSSDTTQPLDIGRINISGRYFNGDIDEVVLYGKAIDPWEIYQKYETYSWGMIGEWDFDESSGSSAIDRAGANYHGTISGATRLTSTLGAAQFGAPTGNMLSFDGVNDTVALGNWGNYWGFVTVEAWLNTTGKSGWGDIIAGPCGDILFALHDNKLTFGGQCSSPMTPVSTTATLNDGLWHHVMASYDYRSICLYIDGVLATCQDVGRFAFVPGQKAMGSAGSGTSEFFSGALENVAIYSKAIDPQVIPYKADFIKRTGFPIAKFNKNPSGETGTVNVPMTFDGGASSDIYGQHPGLMTYYWDFDDGKPVIKQGNSVTVTYTTPGVKQIRLWVLDNDEHPSVARLGEGIMYITINPSGTLLDRLKKWAKN